MKTLINALPNSLTHTHSEIFILLNHIMKHNDYLECLYQFGKEIIH